MEEGATFSVRQLFLSKTETGDNSDESDYDKDTKTGVNEGGGEQIEPTPTEAQIENQTLNSLLNKMKRGLRSKVSEKDIKRQLLE